MSRSRRRTKRLLRVASAADFEPCARGRPPPSPDSGFLHGKSRHLRRASGLSRSPGSGRSLQQASRGPADARGRSSRAAWVSHAALGGRDAIGPDPESPATTIRHDAAQQGLGHRHHLHPHVAGLALPGGRHGLVLAHDRGGRPAPRFTASSCSMPSWWRCGAADRAAH